MRHAFALVPLLLGLASCQGGRAADDPIQSPQQAISNLVSAPANGADANEPPLTDPIESILSEYTPQAPHTRKPPPYTLLRFNEDYRYLAREELRTDLFDPAKYIPLWASGPGNYLSFGGEIRERYEHYTNPGYGIGRNPEQNDYLLQRITLDADLHVNDHLRFFVQGISGLQFNGVTEKAPVNQNPLDLQQAFMDIKFSNDPVNKSEPYLVARGGRFEMSYGSGRLVATRAAPNIPFKFDGVQLIGSACNAKIYAFATKPAREQKDKFDDEFPGQAFWGVYATVPPLGTPLKMKLDAYYLGFQDEKAHYATLSGREERHTCGARLYGKSAGFDYDIEPVVQFGSVSNRDILAWTFASSCGYTFETTPWHPRLGGLFDVASGDTGKSGSFGTFNPLFFKAGYFNDASLIRPSNIVDAHGTLQLEASESVVLTFGSDSIWRYTNHDGTYAPPGRVTLSPGAGSRYVATTAEASAEWKLNRHLTWTTSYVHFFTGERVERARGKDVDFAGTWMTFVW